MNRNDIFDASLKLIDYIYVNIQQSKDENFVEKMNELFMSFENIITENSNDIQYIENLNKGLALMERAMVNKDYFLMSDYIFYEVRPVIESWKNK